MFYLPSISISPGNKVRLDFSISSGRPVSDKFIELGITSFAKAAQYVQQLPYKRNSNKSDILGPLKEQQGTCSTKHALLAQLAFENKHADIVLKLGIFRMGAKYSPAVGKVLSKYGLEFIPEAHNYLCYKGQVFDFTTPDASPDKFFDDLIVEITIDPNEITDFKVSYHKELLQKWILYTPLSFTLDELWKIREECIAALSTN